MKKFFTLRNILVCAGAFLGLLIFIFSFLTAFRLTNGSDWNEYRGIIWGCRTVAFSDGSSVTASGDDALKAVGLPLVGAILALVAALGAAFVVLFGSKVFKNEKVSKIVLIACGGLLVLGGVFAFFTQAGFEKVLADEAGISVENLKKLWDAAGTKVSCGLPIVSGIFAILGGAAIVVSQFLPNKK